MSKQVSLIIIIIIIKFKKFTYFRSSLDCFFFSVLLHRALVYWGFFIEYFKISSGALQIVTSPLKS